MLFFVVFWASFSSASKYTRDILTPYGETHGSEHDQTLLQKLQSSFWGSLTFEKFSAAETSNNPVVYRRQFIEYNSHNHAVPGHIIYTERPRQTFSVIEPDGRGGCGLNPYGEANMKYARFPWPVQATVRETANTANCSAAMNAGYFGVHSGQCLGTLVVNGHVLQVSNNTNAVFGIRQDGTLVTGYIPNEEIINTSNPFVHLVSGVIWLVRKGLSYVDESAKAESSDNEGTGTMNQFIDVVSARTAIGHDRQGRIVFVHIEGQTDLRGMNLHDFARLLVKLGLVNAINMDGGGSATMVENGTLISYPTDHCHNPSFRCMREVSTIVCIHPPVCKYPICSGHGECQLGICKCNKPWTGEGCQLLNCSIMKCNGRGICANTSSQCNCTKPGYTGPLCDKVCPQGFYGPGCNNKCSCYHFSRCNPENGSCTCKAGWRGKSCNKPCVAGRFGQGCLIRCNCSHNHCIPFTGQCVKGKACTGPSCLNMTATENVPVTCNNSFHVPENSESNSDSVPMFLVILLGLSVFINAILMCALSYFSQKTRTRY